MACVVEDPLRPTRTLPERVRRKKKKPNTDVQPDNYNNYNPRIMFVFS